MAWGKLQAALNFRHPRESGDPAKNKRLLTRRREDARMIRVPFRVFA